MLLRGKTLSGAKDARCLLCGEPVGEIARCIGICPTCVRNRPEESRKRIERVHAESREMFSFPTRPPANPQGIECKLCFTAAGRAVTRKDLPAQGTGQNRA